MMRTNKPRRVWDAVRMVVQLEVHRKALREMPVGSRRRARRAGFIEALEWRLIWEPYRRQVEYLERLMES